MTILPEVWRPSTLQVLDTCPRRFALRQANYRYKPDPLYPPTPHAEFGTIWHKAAEQYDTLIFTGHSKFEALDETIASAYVQTWDNETNQPWGGSALELWTCTGLIRSATGRRKFLCDGARDWWAGDTRKCPKCGRETERRTAYVPANAGKNRHTLLRSVVTYCENAEGFRVGSFDKISPALEAELEFNLGPYRVQMHMDRYSELGEQRFCHERKTTSRQVGAAYWLGYEQSLQVQMYDLGMRQESLAITLPPTSKGQIIRERIGPQRCDGVILEALQVQAGGERLSRHIIERGPAQRQETVDYVIRLIHEARMFADLTPLLWPTRLSSCLHAAGGMPCEYLKVCAKPTQAARQYELETAFVQESRK